MFKRRRRDSEGSLYQDCLNESQFSDRDSEISEIDVSHNGNFTPIPTQLGMGLGHVDIATDGAIIGTNGRKSIVVHEFQEHISIPDYPDTDQKGILHFIHYRQDSLKDVGEESSAITRAFQNSHRRYGEHMFYISLTNLL
jgi:hypothetical protein